MKRKERIVETYNETPFSLFSNRLHLLSPDMQDKITKGMLQICPHSFYSIKRVGGVQQVDMFDTRQSLGLGYSNVTDGIMLQEDCFLITEITLFLYKGKWIGDIWSDFSDKTPIDSARSGVCAHGEFSLSQEGTTYIQQCPVSLFKDGRLIMTPPKMYYPKRQIGLRIQFPSEPEKDTWIRAELNGVRTIKA